MDHSTPVYYEDHHQFEAVPIGEDDEEYQEDRFLRQHYSRPNANFGGLGLVHENDDDISESDDDYNPLSQRRRHHQNGNNSQLYDDDDDDDDDIEEGDEDDDEYDELDMDHHSIQLLSGSLSVRSPFLDAIREEEDEEPAAFTKPSSYPSFGTGRYLNRLSGDGSAGAWGGRGSLGASTLEKQHQLHIQQQLEQQQQLEKQKQDEHQQQAALSSDQQGTNFNNTNQSDNGKPRGPRPPLMLGRPRSNTSLTKVVTGFDVPSSSSSTSTSTANQLSKDEVALRNSQASPESTMQDLEVKRVLEGAAALASGGAPLSNSADPSKSAESTPLPSSSKSNQNTISLFSGGSGATHADPTASFGTDTQKSIDNFFGMVKSDLDKRIQEAIQEVEQKFLDRVKRLEEHTATLAGAPPELLLANASGDAPKAGSLMESLTRPLPAHQNPGGSLALRKEILSHVTEKVGDLDLRVNQMEVLVSYKLVDIESKVI